MKKLFWIVLLVNVIFFVFMQWGRILWGEPVAQGQPALHEEMIRLIDMPQSAPAAELPVPVPVATEVNNVTPLESNGSVCLEWGEFSGEDLAKAITGLYALQLGDKLSHRQIEHNIGFWVYIPPLKDKAAVDKKVSQLKAIGIGEYFVVQEAGPWRNAISLGIFKTHEAAQNFLDVLRTKNVRTARVGERASKLRATIFSLNGVNAATEAKLVAMQKDFAESELKNVPCTLTR